MRFWTTTRKLTIIVSFLGILAIRTECGNTVSTDAAICWSDSYGFWAVGGVGALPTKEAFKQGLKAGARQLPRVGVMSFRGYTVTATKQFMKEVRHYPVAHLRRMAERGNAGRKLNRHGGMSEDVWSVHHIDRNKKGPLALIPSSRHGWWNKRQHPRGKPAMTDKERNEFGAWRVQFWKEQGRKELLRRGLKP